MRFPSRLFRRLCCIVSILGILLCISGCAATPPAFSEDSRENAPTEPDFSPSPMEASPADPTLPPAAEETLPPEPEREAAGFIRPEVTITSFPGQQSPSLLFALDAVLVPGEITGQDISHQMTSLDGSTVSLLSAAGELWIVHGGQLRRIAQNAVYEELSLDGSSLIWLNSSGTLTLLDPVSDTSVAIAENVRSAAISPEGGSVAYSVGNPDGSVSAWICSDGESRPLGEELSPFALAENGELVYALGTKDGLLYILDETGASVGPACPVDPYWPVTLSSDHRQILFRAGDTGYFRDRGGEALEISGQSPEVLILPNGCVFPTRSPLGFPVRTAPTDSLPGHYYLDSENTLCYMDMDTSMSLISTDVNTGLIYAAWDGDSLFYCWNDGTLFRTERSCPGSPTLLGSDVAAFVPTGDFRSAYCLDSQGRLLYLEDFHEPRLIAENVHQIALTWDDWCLYLTGWDGNSGELWASQAGNEGTQVEARVSGLRVGPTVTLLWVGEYGQSSVFCATEGISFHPLTEER